MIKESKNISIQENYANFAMYNDIMYIKKKYLFLIKFSNKKPRGNLQQQYHPSYQNGNYTRNIFFPYLI